MQATTITTISVPFDLILFPLQRLTLRAFRYRRSDCTLPCNSWAYNAVCCPKSQLMTYVFSRIFTLRRRRFSGPPQQQRCCCVVYTVSLLFSASFTYSIHSQHKNTGRQETDNIISPMSLHTKKQILCRDAVGSSQAPKNIYRRRNVTRDGQYLRHPWT